MNAVGADRSWTDANQRHLTAELARIGGRFDPDQGAAGRPDVDGGGASHMPSAIDVVLARFGLSPFERDVLLLCAGVEMSASVARQCAEAHGHPLRRYATFGLALAVLEDPHWSALSPTGPLRRWRLVDVDDAEGLTAGRLRIDERVLHFLAGLNDLDPRLQAFVRPAAPAGLVADSHRRIAKDVAEALRHRPGRPVLLTGDDPDGHSDIARLAATRLGIRLHVVSARDLPAAPAELSAVVGLWRREAALLESALLVRDASGQAAAVRRLVEDADGPVLVSSAERSEIDARAYHVVANKPDRGEQLVLWREALGPHAAAVDGALPALSSHFRLSARAIHAIGDGVAHRLESSGPDVLWSACRVAGRARLDELAERVATSARWGDLVLPHAQMATLRSLASHAQHRSTVYDTWGLGALGTRGLGVTALFAGESGTGKTMAAEVLAHELRLDLYRIDLSSVVSKYIGETEKHLRQIFDAADEGGAMLLFDEADALFGKRSEVKDSHDRYANIEVSYLLQRMESFRGLAVLTTNAKGALDAAFQRRLRFVVPFPFPDAAQREAIWRRMFPPQTPTASLDFGRLARLSASGGHIRGIALNAAFLAAAAGEPVGMSHLLQAAHGEAVKRDRALSDAEVRGWV